MHDLCKAKFKQYEKVEKSFSKFFNVDDLAVRFDRKADLRMIHDLNVKKANEHDLQNAQSAIDNLNERIK